MAVGQAKTIPEKYQAKVGRLQDADRLYAKEDGYFVFFDKEYTGKELRNFFKSMYASVITVANSAGVLSVLSGETIPTMPAGGRVYFSVATAGSNTSALLPVPEAGDILYLDGGGLAISASIVFLASNTTLCGGSGLAGVTLHAHNGVVLSAIALAMSALSGYPRFRLVCHTAGTWSVVERTDEDSGQAKYYPNA